jgi:hypothetical protein
MPEIQWKLKTCSTGYIKLEVLVSSHTKIYETDTHKMKVVVPCIPHPEEYHSRKHYEHPTGECSNHLRQQ